MMYCIDVREGVPVVKETCERCRALRWLSGTTPECVLGYKIDCNGPKPLEACEKPLTYLDLIEARKEKNNGV